MREFDSIAEVEGALREKGFFEGGAEGLVADVFLGYRLSDRLRRGRAPAPEEPIALPAAAVRVRRVTEPPSTARSYSVGTWRCSWAESEYGTAVQLVKDSIAAGDIYQVNLVQHLSAPFSGDPAGLAERLAPLSPLQPR